MEEFETLNDYLQEGLDIVFVGINPSEYSVRAGHYFANPRNRFWAALNMSGLVDREVSPEDDAELIQFGIGFTDLVKRPTPQASGLKAADYRQGVPVLREKLLRYQPRIVCFHGVTVYQPYLLHVEKVKEKIELGLQRRSIGSSRVYVVPNPSPANAAYSLEVLASWYRQLQDLRQQILLEAAG
ncbi:MAG: hypothetical protein BZY88_14340 [SAR202 cluster bacterium Io17-Chloro-G9]|nr:MAG: hypothetical protein BZY88_14340 [SAR202 cluster bacterium Io17-Chloro-G9]